MASACNFIIRVFQALSSTWHLGFGPAAKYLALMESACLRGATIGMQTVRTKTCLGLPSLSVPRGPRTQKGSCSRFGPQLQRCWTLRSKGPSTTTVAALPLPFLEISVSVLDTLDLVRSSVEEEVSLPALISLSPCLSTPHSCPLS